MSLASVDSFSASAQKTVSPGRSRQRPSVGPQLRRLRPDSETVARALPVEIAFLAQYGVPAEVLRYAAALSRRQGVCADEALLAEGLVSEETYYRALADHLDAPFIETPEIVAAPGEAAVNAGFARLRDSEAVWLLAPCGAAVFRLISAARAARGRALFAVTSRARFVAAARRAAPLDIAQFAAGSAERANPLLCVRRVFGQRPLLTSVAVFACLLAALFSPEQALAFAAALPFAVAFLASVYLRLFACAASFEVRDNAGWLAESRLPVYTVVIALYKEARVASQLARAIDRLDYPRAKLDVKFVIEADDAETGAALRAHCPQAPHEVIVAPAGAPRTKPRALNVAMRFARGDLIAVFDAEDLPEPRQLRRAAALFAQLPQTTACLQASLAIDNGALNWMTALFALEYAALFDVHNKGLSAMGLPLFLGGTSNHFRLEALREIGFWDAFNVTEDADLGLRLARAGYRVRTFASETYEEAPATLRALVRQRTRWFKGWMQTALVHCRRPLRLVADLGPLRAGATLATFAGGFLGPLIGPLLAGRLVYDAAYGPLLSPATVFEAFGSTMWCFLALSGGGALLWPLIVGMKRRRLTGLWPAFFLLPAWLLMLSFSAWRALYQFWRDPFRWEKTEHGLTQRAAPSGIDAPAPRLRRTATA